MKEKPIARLVGELLVRCTGGVTRAVFLTVFHTAGPPRAQLPYLLPVFYGMKLPGEDWGPLNVAFAWPPRISFRKYNDNLVPRVLSLPPSRKYPGFSWSRAIQNLGANKNVLQGRGSKVYKIVTSVRMVERTGGDVRFFRNICGDKNSFYRQVFLHYIRTFDIEAVHVIFDSEKHVYKSLNFKTLSLTIAIVNGSRHESQRNKFTTRRTVGFMLSGARNEMECQGLGRTNLFLASPRSSRIFGNRTQDRQMARW